MPESEKIRKKSVSPQKTSPVKAAAPKKKETPEPKKITPISKIVAPIEKKETPKKEAPK